MFNIQVRVLSRVSICLIYCDHPCSGPPIITTCHPGSALWQQYYVKCDAASEKLIQPAKIKSISMHFPGISSWDRHIGLCSNTVLQYTNFIYYTFGYESSSKFDNFNLSCHSSWKCILVSYSFCLREFIEHSWIKDFFGLLSRSSPHQPVLFILSELFFLFFFSN